MLDYISFLWYCFTLWIREAWLKLKGVDRNFYCQREEEFESKCTTQCPHCEEYYRPLVELKKNSND